MDNFFEDLLNFTQNLSNRYAKRHPQNEDAFSSCTKTTSETVNHLKCSGMSGRSCVVVQRLIFGLIRMLQLNTGMFADTSVDVNTDIARNIVINRLELIFRTLVIVSDGGTNFVGNGT